MVKSDRAYIPALSVTNEADTVRSKVALAALTAEWRAFQQRYGNWGRFGEESLRVNASRAQYPVPHHSDKRGGMSRPAS